MNRPRLTQSEAHSMIEPYKLPEEVKLLGIRGYYKRTMGNPVKNDRGIYDDAIFILAPELFAAFNANTDPSVFTMGIACLKNGIWWYQPGRHKMLLPSGYPALIQAEEVTVVRDGKGEDTGWFGINIHKGGYHTTSSLGCQTIYPAQWEGFIGCVYDQLYRYGQKKIPYILTELN